MIRACKSAIMTNPYLPNISSIKSIRRFRSECKRMQWTKSIILCDWLILFKVNCTGEDSDRRDSTRVFDRLFSPLAKSTDTDFLK